jgi:hypothetical protein
LFLRKFYIFTKKNYKYNAETKGSSLETLLAEVVTSQNERHTQIAFFNTDLQKTRLVAKKNAKDKVAGLPEDWNRMTPTEQAFYNLPFQVAKRAAEKLAKSSSSN